MLDYCLHAGSENVVVYFKDNIYVIKYVPGDDGEAQLTVRTLKEFVYVDEGGKDVGANVRQKAKDITNLLQDDERLRSERKSRGAMRDRMLGNLATSGLQGDRDYGDRNSPPPDRPQSSRPAPRRNNNNEDDDLQKAIAESMRMQEEEAKRRSQVTQEDDDFQRALRMSEEEEARRKREQDKANETALFDDSLNL